MKQVFFKVIRVVVGGMIVLADKLIPPSRVKLSAEQQAKRDEASSGLILYQFPSCPFCIRVRRHSRRLSIPLKTRDVLSNEQWHQELETQGGKRKVPCLRIEEEGGTLKWLYESKAIIHYLTVRFELS